MGQGDLHGGGWNEFREPACGGRAGSGMWRVHMTSMSKNMMGMDMAEAQHCTIGVVTSPGSGRTVSVGVGIT